MSQSPELEANEKPSTSPSDEKPPEPAERTMPPAMIVSNRAPIVNFTISRTNWQLHRLFLQKRTEECILVAEQLLQSEPEELCEFALVVRAQIALEQGDARTAVECLTRAVKNCPKSGRLLYLLGKAAYLQGDHSKAVQCFRQAIQYSPESWRAYYWAAKCYYHSETEQNNANLNKAQEVLMSCPRIHKCPDVLALLAKICVQKEDHVPATEAFKRALVHEQENLDLIAQLAIIYLKTNATNQATAFLGKALSYDPTHVPSILAMSKILQTNHDFDAALVKYRVAVDKCDYSGAIWNNVGMCFYGKGKLVAAIICLKKAHYLCPLDARVLFNLSIVHRSMLQFASAYHFIASAINLHPQNVIYIMTIAMILTDLEDFESARKAYKKAMSIDPTNIAVRMNFAIFEYRRGNVKEAALLTDQLSFNQLDDSAETAEVLARISQLKDSIAKAQV